MAHLQVGVNLILGGIIAGLATALSGAFILPSVAGNDLRKSIGLALLGVGRSLSGWVFCTSLLCLIAVDTAAQLSFTRRTFTQLLMAGYDLRKSVDLALLSWKEFFRIRLLHHPSRDKKPAQLALLEIWELHWASNSGLRKALSVTSSQQAYHSFHC